MPFSTRPTFAQIDLGVLRENLRSSREFIGPDVRVMAVVKANAYGHGAVECARTLESERVDWLGVALLEEAIQLRDAGIKIPILCLGGFPLGREALLLEHNITPVVFNIEQAKALQMVANHVSGNIQIHVKIDTGMGRLGVRWDDLDEFITALARLRNLHLEGLMSHFAIADETSQDAFTQTQINRFFESVATFEAAGLRPQLIDIANSPGAIGHPNARFGMVRLGGILYGLSTDVLSSQLPQPELKPVMTLYSIVSDIKSIPKGETIGYGRTFTCVRDTRIALLPIGYDDGYRRALSNKAAVIINGQLAPVVGRISMDWTIADITEVTGVGVGDSVIMLGRNNDIEVSAADLAALSETISYEITCGISERVPRRYIGRDSD